MGKCTDNPKHDIEESNIQNTFKHTAKVLTKEEVMENRSSAYEFIDFDIEEAYGRIFNGKLDRVLKAGFIAGAEYMRNKMYSEEVVLNLITYVKHLKYMDGSKPQYEFNNLEILNNFKNNN